MLLFAAERQVCLLSIRHQRLPASDASFGSESSALGQNSFSAELLLCLSADMLGFSRARQGWACVDGVACWVRCRAGYDAGLGRDGLCGTSSGPI